MKRHSRRESSPSRKYRNDASLYDYDDVRAYSSNKGIRGTDSHDLRSNEFERRSRRRDSSYERNDIVDIPDPKRKYDPNQLKYSDYDRGSYHSHRLDEFVDSPGSSRSRQMQQIPRGVATNDRPTSRIDPVFAAAAAAALNASLGPAPGNDFASLALRNVGGVSQSAMAAVTAAAVNAAALAAALSGASPTLAAAGLGGLARPLRVAAGTTANNRTIYEEREQPGRDKEDRRDTISSSGKVFPHHLDHRDPEDDPSSTRTIFIGNLAPDVSESQLAEIFEKYGFIEDIDIKRPAPGSGSNAYAFLRFVNLDMAHRAKVDMSGRMIGQFTCKIGYGKVTATRCLWISGLGPWITYPAFASLLNKFGPPERIIWPSGKNYAHVLFRTVELATVAASTLRGYALGGLDRRIRVDFTDESYMSSDPLIARRKASAPNPENDEVLRKTARPIYSRPTSGSSRHGSYHDNSVILHPRTGERDRRRTGLVTSPGRVSGRRSSSSHTRYSRSPDRRVGDRGRNGVQRSGNNNFRPSPSQEEAGRRQGCTPERSTHRKSLRESDRIRQAAKTLERRSIGQRDSRSPDNGNTAGPLELANKYISHTLESAVNVEQLALSLPTAWDGIFHLKNSSFDCKMHILRGDESLVDQFLPRRRRIPKSKKTHLAKTLPDNAASLSRAIEANFCEVKDTFNHQNQTVLSDTIESSGEVYDKERSQPCVTSAKEHELSGGRPRTPPEEDEETEGEHCEAGGASVTESIQDLDHKADEQQEEKEEGEEDDDDEDEDDKQHPGTGRPTTPERESSPNCTNKQKDLPAFVDNQDDTNSSEEEEGDDLTNSSKPICLRITQRMKLDPLKLDDVSQRIKSAGNAGFCVLLAIPAQVSSSVAPSAEPTASGHHQQQRPLRNLITYLRTKDSAGVVLLNPLSESAAPVPAVKENSAALGGSGEDQLTTPDGLPITGVLHAFPPCDFSFDLLRQHARQLQKETAKDNHLVILLIRSSDAF